MSVKVIDFCEDDRIYSVFLSSRCASKVARNSRNLHFSMGVMLTFAYFFSLKRRIGTLDSHLSQAVQSKCGRNKYLVSLCSSEDIWAQ